MVPSTVYDLTALMAQLESGGGHVELVETIRRAADVSSAHRDLDEALSSLRLLRRLTSGFDETPLNDADLSTIVGSLLTSAVVLYARATDTDPIGRRRWFGASKLAVPLRPVHREIMLLRDKEIAHFGRGQIVDGSTLLVEALVLRPFDKVHPIGHLSNRAQNRAALVRRFEQLVERVSELCIEAVNRRHSEVFEALTTLTRDRDPVMELLRSFALTDERLLMVEMSTHGIPSKPGATKDSVRVAVVELHDDPDWAEDESRE